MKDELFHYVCTLLQKSDMEITLPKKTAGRKFFK